MAERFARFRQRWSGRLVTAIGVVLFILPLAVYSLDVYRYAVDAPYWDDYMAILDFTNRFVQMDSVTDKLAMLFSQHNEHRIVPTRLASVVQYYAFGQINFRQLIMLGASGWVLAIVVLALGLKKRYNLPLSYLLPIPYLLASAVHYENRLYAMVAIQNYNIILFSLVFLFYLAASKTARYILFFAVALFTSGGGLVLYPLGNAFLLVRKQWRSFLLFLLASSVCLAAYFFNYHSPATISLADAIVKFEQTIVWFVAFLGGATGTTQLAVVVGFATLLMLAAILVWRTGDDLLFLLAGYILLVAATTALNRVGLGLEVAVRSAYTMYSLLAWICVYVFVVTALKDAAVSKKIALITLAVAMVFFAGFYAKYQASAAFSTWRTERSNGLLRFVTGNKDGLAFYDKDKAALILLESERLGVYDYKKDYKRITPLPTDPSALPTGGPLDAHIDNQQSQYLNGWALIPELDAASSRISIILANGAAFTIPTMPVKRSDVSAHYQKGNLYDDAGFEALIPVEKLPSGTYKVGVLVHNGDQDAFAWTDVVYVVP